MPGWVVWISMTRPVTGSKRLDFGYGVAPDKKHPMPKHGIYLERGHRVPGMEARPTLQLAVNKTEGAAALNWGRALRLEKF